MKELFSVSNHRPTHPQSFGNMLNAKLAKLKDGLYWFEMKRVTEKRTLNQNSYLWALLTILAEACGLETPEAMLMVVMQRLGRTYTVNVLGVQITQRQSIRADDITECGAIIDECFVIASFMNEDREPEHHIILPVPPQKGEN